MPIQTQVITGVLSAPDGTFLSGYFVRFRLSAYDATDNGVISATKTYTLPIESDGSIAGDIWPNTAGVGGTVYQVHVLDDKQREVEFLGKLQIGTDGPYDLADLIRSQSPTPNPSYIRLISQAEYNAITAAATSTAADRVQTGLDRVATGEDRTATEALRDQAQGYATAAGAAAGFFDFSDLATLQADTTLTYTAGQDGTVTAGDIVTTEAEGFSYEVAASGATDQHVTTAGGVKLYVLPGEYGYDVRAFGAPIDGVTSASLQVQSAADAAAANGVGLGSPQEGVIYLDAAVDLRGIKYIEFKTDILVDPAIVGVPVTVGGRAQVIGGRWCFNEVSDGTSVITGTPPSRPILRITGSKAVHIEIGNCQFVQFYADSAISTQTSNAYNSVFLHGAVYKMEMFGEAGVSWNNENFVYGGRLKKLILDGTNYGHNHNKFFHNTFEGSEVDIQFLGGCHVNSIYGARFELTSGSTGVTFGAETYSNYVEYSWSGAGDPRNQFINLTPVSDSGKGNAVFSEAASKFTSKSVLSFGRGSLMLGTSTGVGTVNSSWSDIKNHCQSFGLFDASPQTIVPELSGVSWIYGSRYIAATDYIPVSFGDVIRSLSQYDGSLLRFHVYVFDEDMKPLTTEGGGGVFVRAIGYSFTSANGYGFYQIGSNATDIPVCFAIMRTDVKFVKIAVYGPTVGIVEEFSLDLLYNPLGRPFSEDDSKGFLSMPVLNATPTKGYVPAGFGIYETSGPSTKICAYAHETVTSGALSAGATSVTVLRIQSVANGDVVGILMDNGATHWTSVSGLSGSTFTIAAIPTGRSVASGSRIVFNRWA